MSTLPVEHVAVQQGQPMMTAQPVLFQGAYGMQIPPIQSAPGGYMYGYPGSPGVQMMPSMPMGALGPAPGGEQVLNVQKEVAAVADAPEENKGHVAFAEVGYKDIFKQFVMLGWTAFGGPAAHIGLFQKVPISRYVPGVAGNRGGGRGGGAEE
ncbi:hypothetical protein T484DRAFT_1846012 [Baffinella frigidus]|nr:hypothetical protein T484DRAFT_1846012 [Cryptophyta sp. CCMP2293]